MSSLPTCNVLVSYWPFGLVALVVVFFGLLAHNNNNDRGGGSLCVYALWKEDFDVTRQREISYTCCRRMMYSGRVRRGKKKPVSYDTKPSCDRGGCEKGTRRHAEEGASKTLKSKCLEWRGWCAWGGEGVEEWRASA